MMLSPVLLPRSGRALYGLATALLLALLASIAGCASSYQPMGPTLPEAPRIEGSAFESWDGARLPFKEWQPIGKPWGIIVALHGMNDYSNSFDMAARFWAAQGVATYAYDQRGFGASRQPGIWSDTDTMVADLNAAVDAVSRRHPGVPVYVLGESMGGAVVVAALTAGPSGIEPPLARRIHGAILSAPAMWGRQSMNPLYRFTLWIAYNAFPSVSASPPRGLRIWPSDNVEMLRALGRDPLVLKQTRFDALEGLVDLMSVAEGSIQRLPNDVPILVLYGRHEQVLPKSVVSETLKKLDAMQDHPQLRVALYGDGYHMLLRDMHADIVWEDVVAWMRAPAAALPSGADAVAQRTPPQQGVANAPAANAARAVVGPAAMPSAASGAAAAPPAPAVDRPAN
jgi:alpha-beta hydrolase superfamily lysophospholipase